MKIRKIYRLLFIIIIFALMGIYTLWRERVLSKNARYTIGITGDIYWTTMSGKKVDFVYFVKQKSYRGSENYLNDSITNDCNCRYYVEFDHKNPSYGKLLQKKRVPDSIKAAPPEGWSRLPGE